MARKSAKSAPGASEVEGAGDESAAGSGEGGGHSVSKAVAIRSAIDAGVASPQDGVDYVMKHFGVEISKPHFSAVKSQYKSESSSLKIKVKRKPGPKPKAGRAVEGYLAAPPKAQSSRADGDVLRAMEAMKPLVASLGADKVKRIVDLLG